jgi:hypothetical protein
MYLSIGPNRGRCLPDTNLGLVVDVGSPQWGLGKRQLLVTLCVTLSLTLFALGSADLSGGFSLGTLSFGRPTVIVGPILDTFVVSRDAEGTVCEELGRSANMGLLRLLLLFVRARFLAFSVVTPHGYKVKRSPLCTPTSSCTNKRCLLPCA